MKTENRHINIQEPEGMMLLRYIKDTASNEEKSYIEAWLEADENNQRILLQTARIYYANNAMERIEGFVDLLWRIWSTAPMKNMPRPVWP